SSDVCSSDLGTPYTDAFNGMGPILLPIVIAGVGILASIIGTFLVKVSSNDAKEAEVQRALNVGNWTSIILTVIACFFLIQYMLLEVIKMKFFGEDYKDIPRMNIFFATIVGLAVGGLISSFTEYYTGLGKKPVLNIVRNSSTGAAT